MDVFWADLGSEDMLIPVRRPFRRLLCPVIPMGDVSLRGVGTEMRIRCSMSIVNEAISMIPMSCLLN